VAAAGRATMPPLTLSGIGGTLGLGAVAGAPVIARHLDVGVEAAVAGRALLLDAEPVRREMQRQGALLGRREPGSAFALGERCDAMGVGLVRSDVGSDGSR